MSKVRRAKKRATHFYCTDPVFILASGEQEAEQKVDSFRADLVVLMDVVLHSELDHGRVNSCHESQKPGYVVSLCYWRLY